MPHRVRCPDLSLTYTNQPYHISVSSDSHIGWWSYRIASCNDTVADLRLCKFDLGG